ERSLDFAWVHVLQNLSRQKNLNIESSHRLQKIRETGSIPGQRCRPLLVKVGWSEFATSINLSFPCQLKQTAPRKDSLGANAFHDTAYHPQRDKTRPAANAMT